jgi:hypothetical protein
MTTCTTIQADLDAGPSQLVQDLNLFLAANNPLTIETIWHNSRGKLTDLHRLEIVWEEEGANYLALLFVADGGTSATEQANAFFLANPTFRCPWVLDVSNSQRRNLLQDALLILGIADWSLDLKENRNLAIVAPVADIAIGATGAANLIGSTGALGTLLQVQNLSGIVWAAGVLCWAATDPVSRTWQGFRTCCGIAPP